MLSVRKRNGDIEPFAREKIISAVRKAMSDEYIDDDDSASKVAKKSERRAKEMIRGKETQQIDVETLHLLVENSIMDLKLYDVARSYITYRKTNIPDVFRPRKAYRPREYPWADKFVEAIQHSYWIHTDYNYSSDVQDFRVLLTEPMREVVRRSMLLISTVEVKVKDFWGDSGKMFPKPELQEVGATFAESEVRHSRAYSHLLDILGLNGDFESVLDVPCVKKRMSYIEKSMRGAKSGDVSDYIETLLLFSLFIENVSLFSQFLVISSFHKHNASLKGISNAISATALEENLHFLYGAKLIQTIRSERPDIFTQELEDRVNEIADDALNAESEIVEWIFEYGDADFIRKADVTEYVKSRLNRGLIDCGFSARYEVDSSSLERTKWFDLQIDSTMHVDFFAQVSPNYVKKNQDFSENSLFDDFDIGDLK